VVRREEDMAADSRPFGRFFSAATLVALIVGSVPPVVAAQPSPSRISVGTFGFSLGY